MFSKRKLFYLILVIVLSVVAFVVIARVLPDTEVRFRRTNLFEKPMRFPEGLLVVEPEPGSSNACAATTFDDDLAQAFLGIEPPVRDSNYPCAISICWTVDTLSKSETSVGALTTDFIMLLNGDGVENLGTERAKREGGMVTSTGTANPNGSDNIEAQSAQDCWSVRLAPGDYLVTLLASGNSSRPIYEWAFKITSQ